MKQTIKYTSILCMLLIVAFPSIAQEESNNEADFIIVKGKIIDDESSEPLIFASIAIENTNLATVSNSEGRFAIKVPNSLINESLSFTYIGHETLTQPLNTFKNNKSETIRLRSTSIKLSELSVFPDKPDIIINKVLENIAQNYPTEPSLMTAFYRETIKKRRQYTALAEAVVDIYKPSYMNARSEQVLLLKGRKGVNVSKMDTLLFKLQGGAHSMLALDIIKHPYSIISKDIQSSYLYEFEKLTLIDNEIHIILSFKQIDNSKGPLFGGNLYIHAETMAISRATFSLNTSDKQATTAMYIRKKPLGCDIYPVYANYIVNYRKQGDTWHYSYARGEVAFKINWKKRLFGTTYTTSSELAVTNRRSTENRPFKGQEKLNRRTIMNESVSGFYDKAFWGEYNVIEPEKDINTAIKKISKSIESLE